jgi:hypothetical protein
LTRESVSGRRRQGRPCCKMATPQQKAFCILRFAKTNSVTTVQRLFRTRFGIDPPASCNNCGTEQPLHSCYRVGLRKLHDTERLLLWSRHFTTRSPLAAATARNTFLRQLQTKFESFPNTRCTSLILGSLVTSL